MPQTDELYGENLDMVDLGDEWAEGESDQENIEITMLVNKGEIREFPFHGFGIENELKKVADKKVFVRNLTVEIENDGYKNPQIVASDDLADVKVTIDA